MDLRGFKRAKRKAFEIMEAAVEELSLNDVTNKMSTKQVVKSSRLKAKVEEGSCPSSPIDLEKENSSSKNIKQVFIDLTDDEPQQKGICLDTKNDETSSKEQDTTLSKNVKGEINNVEKSNDDADCIKINKDSTTKKNTAPTKKSKKIDSTVVVEKKKKATKTSNKKVRGVQDQEVQDTKKQSSLTDHFQVRRSERKIKLANDEVAQHALCKQILSEVEDGLEIKVLEEKGRGIFAARDFPKGTFVCEYAGELIDFQEAKEREAEYELSPEIGSYMYFFEFKNTKYCVDATKETNRLGRLLNHSKTNNNVHTKIFPIKDIPHLILCASRDIEVGEELLYDYGDRSKKSAEHHPWLLA